jgi:excisionase family DNA binding protein
MDMRNAAKLRRENQGYWNVQELAHIVGANDSTIYDWIESGLIRKARVTLGRRRYYTTREVEEIKQQLKGKSK